MGLTHSALVPRTDRPRLGLYGGAFDPPHSAHVRLVEELVRQCRLDRVWVIPTGQAWHKSRPLTAAGHRLAMTREAFAPLPEVVVDDREIRRNRPSYTVETLLELQAEHPAAQWFLLMGEDQWVNFGTWRRWEEIAQIAQIVVARRPMQAGDGAKYHIEHSSQLSAATSPSPLWLNWQPDTTSSTALRAQSPSDEKQLPAAVARYISEHALYTPKHDH